VLRLIEDAQSEIDFKMIDNANKNAVNCVGMLLPYADTWQ